MLSNKLLHFLIRFLSFLTKRQTHTHTHTHSLSGRRGPTFLSCPLKLFMEPLYSHYNFWKVTILLLVLCQFIVTRCIEHSSLDSPRTLRALPTYRGKSCNKVGGTNFSGSALGTIFTCTPKGKAWHLNVW